jgi:pyruvate ferredoxin oxidoreductase delta subunit
MKRPKIVKFEEPKSLREYPTGASFTSGHLVENNASWRTNKPVINETKCVNCFLCFLLCPEGAIDKSETKVQIDYDFCKGCGICMNHCKLEAIIMVKEE